MSCHDISPELRAKMVDWLLIVKKSTNISNKTLFITVNIMDCFFKNMAEEDISIADDVLYLIGITSLFIATKFEEVKLFEIIQIQEQIGHNKFS